MANKTYDYVGFAGGTKNLETILEQIKISARLHNIKQVILINHEDCWAYGAEGTPSKHCQDLYKAKEAILKLFPYMHVDLDYLHLDGEFDPVPQPLPNHHKQYTTLHK